MAEPSNDPVTGLMAGQQADAATGGASGTGGLTNGVTARVDTTDQMADTVSGASADDQESDTSTMATGGGGIGAGTLGDDFSATPSGNTSSSGVLGDDFTGTGTDANGTQSSDMTGNMSSGNSATGSAGSGPGVGMGGFGMDTSKIAEHMEVVGSDGDHVGIVDHVQDGQIKLTKNDAEAGGTHHLIGFDMVQSVDDKVHLNVPGRIAQEQWQPA